MAHSGFDDVEALILSAVRGDRVGAPRFLRCIAAVSDPSDGPGVSTALLALASRCFGGEPDRQDRGAGPTAGPEVVLARWAGGQAALVWVAPAGGKQRAGLDLMLLGSRGALYHEGALERGPR